MRIQPSEFAWPEVSSERIDQTRLKADWICS
jgi:hypothetical protein